ncbi:hypothetical protein RUM43_002669 [Polyplax serrata]|uniref:Ig-like domain-containing protein n=1 Tax=Polyplax serrata TaxID=468196 RepID=A0AAN8RW25_POLSC
MEGSAYGRAEPKYWEGSNERQLKIRNVDFAASGYYSCSASMEQPIYTKFSEKVELTVFEKQQGDPQITLRKAAYAVGEVIELNCTSEPARPSPAVTWLLNSKELPNKRQGSGHLLHSSLHECKL